MNVKLSPGFNTTDAEMVKKKITKKNRKEQKTSNALEVKKKQAKNSVETFVVGGLNNKKMLQKNE